MRDVDGELVGAGAEDVAADADVVAEGEQLVEREGVFADVGLADGALPAPAVLRKLRESCLTLYAKG